MSGKLFDKYGAILQEDVEVLEACLRALVDGSVGMPRCLRILEIGCHDGNTARGIEAFVKTINSTLAYVGIDPDPGETRPRYIPENGTVIIGDSAEQFEREELKGQFDLVWVDGCHCLNHVILDTVHYAPRVRVGGFICFHDANPRIQGDGYQYHGPHTPAFGINVTDALKAIRFPYPWWEHFMTKIPPEEEVRDCGTMAFRRHA